jgi:hypothetical protein
MAGVTSFITNLCMDCFSCNTPEKTRTITIYIAAHGLQKTKEEDIIPNTGAKLLSFCGAPGELGWMEQPEDLGEYSVDEKAIDESYRIFKKPYKTLTNLCELATTLPAIYKSHEITFTDGFQIQSPSYERKFVFLPNPGEDVQEFDAHYGLIIIDVQHVSELFAYNANNYILPSDNISAQHFSKFDDKNIIEQSSIQDIIKNMINTYVINIEERNEALDIFNNLITNKICYLSKLNRLWQLLNITPYYIDSSCRYILEYDPTYRKILRKKGIRPPPLMGEEKIIAEILKSEKLKIDGGTRRKKRNKTIFRSYYTLRWRSKKYNRKTSNRAANGIVSTFFSKNNIKKKYIKTEKKRKRGRKNI